MAAVIAVWIASIAAAAEAQYYKTGYTGADCSACGDVWPWSPACRWGMVYTVQTGWFREAAGDKGSASCHPLESPLPWSEAVSLEMGERLTYQLKQGSWDEFGFELTVAYTKTSSASITGNNSCATAGCCLKPFKAFCRYTYEQRMRDREVARVWYFQEGSSVPVYTSWDRCVACNDRTRRISTLCKFPSPELLPADQAAKTDMPWCPVLFTVATYCSRQ
jgi:hypothetical protein